MEDYDIILLVFSIVAIVVMALRIWARKIQKSSFELSDYLIVLGLACTLTNNVLYCVGPYDQNGDSRHAHIAVYAQFPLWWSAMAIIRSSIIFLYVRIFPMRWFRLTCYAILILNAVSFVAMFGYLLDVYIIAKECQKFSQAACNKSAEYSHICLVMSLSLNLLLDVVVVILPVPTLWRLQIPISKKMMLSGMFSLGIIICAMTAFRLQVSVVYLSDNQQGMASDILAYFEPSIGTITACLPVLKPVFNKARHVIQRISGRLAMRRFLESGNIPIVMRVSQMWNSVSAQRAERDGEHSIVAMEDWRRVQTEIGSTTQGERPEGGNLPDNLPNIHVQKDIRIEITSDDDRIGAQNV